MNPMPGSGTPNAPGDRRGLGSIGPFNLSPNQELNFTVAYNFSRGNGTVNNITVAENDAVTVQNFFNNVMGTTKPVLVKENLQLFPNPANDQLNIQLPARFSGKNATVQISDYLGREVLTTMKAQSETNLNLNISGLSKGVYLVKVASENQALMAKLVKQ
jgi:protein involved in sex pheromone biosynthesis